jgi:uncharacterized protein involved in response to NO
VVAGRIVPMFTANGLGVEPTRVAWAEKALPPVLVGVVATTILELPGAVEGAVLALAGALVLARMTGWRSLATRSAPLLWILHVGHAFLGVGLLLWAASAFTGSPAAALRSAGLHAITAGAIGSLTLGMMARVSLGHTGRMLVSRPSITAAFGLMVAAGLLRMVAALLPGAAWLLHGAGAAWSLALLIFTVVYTPILTRPRADGKPG